MSAKTIKEVSNTFSFMSMRIDGMSACVSVTMTVKGKDTDTPVFSCVGSIKVRQSGHRHLTDYSGGQCQDTIRGMLDTFPYDNHDGKKVLEVILDLWERNHLNDMQAGCEHTWDNELPYIDVHDYGYGNIYLKWKDYITEGKCKNYKEYSQKTYFMNKANEVMLNYHGEPTKDIIHMINLKLLKINKVEKKYAGHVLCTEHPLGWLCKPCEVCGYKWGSAWNYRPISKIDMAKIEYLLKETHTIYAV